MEKKNPVFMEYHQVKAQMTIYTLAMLYYVTNGAISLYKIWQNQGLSDNLKTFINDLSRQLYAYLDAKTKKLIKSCPEFKNISKAIEVTLSNMDLLEKEKCADIDKMSELFGGMMADMLSYSLEGRFQVIAKEIGNNIGKYIYLIDAIDDLSSDLKTKAYNPLIEKYGTVESMIKEKNALDVALSMYANNAILAFNLIEAHDYSSIINNILSLGFGKESYRIFTKIGDKK